MFYLFRFNKVIFSFLQTCLKSASIVICKNKDLYLTLLRNFRNKITLCNTRSKNKNALARKSGILYKKTTKGQTKTIFLLRE